VTRKNRGRSNAGGHGLNVEGGKAVGGALKEESGGAAGGE